VPKLPEGCPDFAECKLVETWGTPIRLLAGPGTGKTTCLICRLIYLVSPAYMNEDPMSVTAVTFTNSAANEMRQRLAAQKIPGYRDILITTLHSLAVAVLLEASPQRRFMPTRTSDDSFLAMDLAADLSELDGIALGRVQARRLIRLYRKEAATRQRPHAAIRAAACSGGDFSTASSRYRKLLRLLGATDWDDVVRRARRLLRSSATPKARWAKRTRYLLVDEYQDFNPQEQALVLELSGEKKYIFVAGDDDQSIYTSLRFAEPQGIIDFKSIMGAECFEKSVCHRCPKSVVAAGVELISNNAGHRENKTLVPLQDAEEGFVRKYMFLSAQKEAKFVARRAEHHLSKGRSVFLLLCNKQLGDLFIAEFDTMKVPYRDRRSRNDPFTENLEAIMALCGDTENGIALRRLLHSILKLDAMDSFALRSHARENDLSIWHAAQKVVLRTERRTSALRDFVNSIKPLILPGTNEERLLRAVGFLKGRLPPPQMDLFKELDKKLAKSDDIERLLSWFSEYHEDEHSSNAAQGVQIMTMHGAKGRAADIVYIPALESQLMPGDQSTVDQRRLLYVSITRAVRGVYLTCAGTRKRGSLRVATGWQVTGRSPSAFLAQEIPGELVSRFD